MPTSTYVSLLVRSHLRAFPPLPTAEVAALKRLVAELSAIGRNINQIARAVNNQQWPGGPTLETLRSIMQALWITRDYVRDLIKANLASWEAGYEKTGR
jgi:phosphate uptake regulator